MKTYKVTIYPVTPWTISIEANNEKEAKEKALSWEGPAMYAYLDDDLEEWKHDISEWPNIGKDGEVYIEENP